MALNILVTGAGGGVGEGVIKALRMIRDLELRVVAADMSPWAAGLYAADVARLVPRASAPDYVDAIIALCREEKIDAYLPGTDVELAVCAANKARIEDATGARVAIASPAVVEIADDKRATARFLEEQGLAFPRTWLRSEWTPAAAAALGFPLVVKPRIGCRSIGLEVVQDAASLERALARKDDVVVQEHLGSDDVEYTCTVVTVDGAPSAPTVLQRWLRAGDTYRVVPVRDAAIEAYVTRVAEALRAEGSCNFQLRVDRGEPKLFEINARFSGTTPLCAELGMNPVESWLKRSRGIPYAGVARTDAVVLRHWAELVVPRAQLDAMGTSGRVLPHGVERRSL